MFELSILSACSPTWTQVATGQIPISSNYTGSTALNVNIADCQTECQTETACLGIAHADNGWAGLDCRLLYYTTDLTDTVYSSRMNLYEITRCQEQRQGDSWFKDIQHTSDQLCNWTL